MFEFLRNYDGRIVVNGVEYNASDIDKINDIEGEVNIYLTPAQQVSNNVTEYYVEVLDWMTIKSDENTRFHEKYNNGIAMPEYRMIGQVIGSEIDVIKMKLHTIDNAVTWTGYIQKRAIIRFEEIKK